MLPAAADAADAVWAPAGKWNLDLGTSSCTLGRVFAANGKQISLGFLAAPPVRPYSLLLAVPMEMFPGPGLATVTVPGAPSIKAPLQFAGIIKPGLKQITVDIDRAQVPAMLSAKEISIQSQGETLTFQTGGSDGAVKAMSDCEADLIREWKIDQAQLDVAAARPPTPISPQGWIKASDYPREARDAKKQGTVSVAYRVEPSGRIEDCRVIESSGTPALDEASCSLIRDRAHFQPARDAAGQPVALWQRRVVPWVLSK